MLHFSIFGIPVRVEPWFWITMAFIGGGLHASNSVEIMLVLVFVFAGFLSIMVHELGHALMVRRFGLPTAITLQAFGGYASFPAGRLSRVQSFIVTAMGPGVQFLLGGVLILVGAVLPIPEGSLFGPFLRDLIWISVAWSILNCLPVYPMDGGQMLAAILGPARQRFVHLVSVLVAVGIGILGFFVLKAPILAVFMGLFAWQNWQAYQANQSR